MSCRRAAAGALAALLLGTPHPGAAQDVRGQDAKATAQTLFDEAMALRRRGDFAEACIKLDESLRLDHAPGTKFYLAECLEQTGKLASAWTLYTEVADEMANTGQQKREVFARERSAALASRVAKIAIVVPDAAKTEGLVVRRDNLVVGEAQWGVAVPVDFGKHTIEATSPRMRPFSKTVDLQGDGTTITIVLPSSITAATVTTATASATAPTPPPVTPTAAPPPSLRNAGLAFTGVGLAGLGAGAALGVLAITKKDESNAGPCDAARDVCSRDGLALRADAMTAATGSTVAFAVSGAVLAVGVTLLVLPMTGAVRTAVLARPDGLTLEGRW